jgi:predicted PolB exonuclease-like 3'-5' exonuclease
MKKLFLDIETLPAEEEKHGVLKAIHEDMKSKGKKVADSFDEYLEKTNFDGSFGRIFCISVATNNDPVKCLYSEEKEILKNFWDLARDADLFIGHTVFDFDLRFIYQRSAVLGVKPSRDLSFARYRNNPIYDIMYEWSKWNMQNKITLDKMAKAFGIKSSKEGGMDGSKVHEAYKKGRFQDIYDYCDADVDVTRAIYKKMTFEI